MLAARLQARGAAPAQAEAAARLGLGDGERALALALGDGPRCAPTPRPSRARRCTVASAPSGRGPRCSGRGARAARRRARRTRRGSRRSSSSCPRKEHKRRETEIGEQARRAERRAQTAALDHGLQLAGLWYRDLACVAAGAPELAHHADRAEELAERRRGREPAALRAATELVDDFRARLALNVSYDLACEALAFRLERLLRRAA